MSLLRPVNRALFEDLREVRVKNVDKRYLLPDSHLDLIFDSLDTEACVKELQVPPHLARETVKAISRGGRKIFAVLSLIGSGREYGDLITKFFGTDGLVKTPYIDSKLPIKKEELEEILGDVPLASEFYDRQWELLSPFFQVDRSHRMLDAETIMPFVDRKQLPGGGFGAIYVETLAPQHHGFREAYDTTGKVKIVRKELTPMRKTRTPALSQAFKEEERILSFLRELRHPNIIPLLASYTLKRAIQEEEEDDEEEDTDSEKAQRFGTYQLVHNLIFPLADGDLSDLFSNPQAIALRRIFPQNNDLYHQLFCLSSALESLHNYFYAGDNLAMIGCHFDLAPRNILLHKGILLLADFGMSRLKSQTLKSTTPFTAGNGDYISPECQYIVNGGFAEGSHGRGSDIWSFGCLLVEIITFVIRDVDGIKAFRKRRTHKPLTWFTSTDFHVGGQPSKEVEKWLNELESSNDRTQRDTLVLARQALNVDPQERIKAAYMVLTLFDITRKAILVGIQDVMESLLVKNHSLELDVERYRLSIWGEEFQIAGLAKQIQERGVRFEDLESILQLMRSIGDQLDIHSQTTKIGPSVLPLWAPIRRMVDRLLMSTSDTVQQRMQSRLEDRILEMDLPLDSGNQTPSLDIHEPNLRRLGQLIAIKHMVSKLNSTADALSEVNATDLLIPRESIKLDNNRLGSHRLGNYVAQKDQEQPILCEWITYDIHWVDQDQGELFARVQDIARIFQMDGIPSGLRVLRCIGYFHEMSRRSFGLAFSLPKLEHAETIPLSLQTILRQQPSRPFLGNLFEIAVSVSNSIQTLHKTRWLHKNISSFNIIFFGIKLAETQGSTKQSASQSSPAASSSPITSKGKPRSQIFKGISKGRSFLKGNKEQQNAPLPPLTELKNRDVSERNWLMKLPEPYVIGFNHSRPNTLNAFTEGPPQVPGEGDYQHPEYANSNGARFRAGFDYYSVGLVLLEIGCWKRLKDLIPGDIADYSPYAQQQHWLDHAVPKLGQSMGKLYMEAVRVCLSDQLLKAPNPEQAFEINVLKPLKACCA